MLKCFDTLKKSLETQREAEYKLNNMTIDNGQWFNEFQTCRNVLTLQRKVRNTKQS